MLHITLSERTPLGVVIRAQPLLSVRRSILLWQPFEKPEWKTGDMTLEFKYQKYEEALAESYTLVRYIRYM